MPLIFVAASVWVLGTALGLSARAPATVLVCAGLVSVWWVLSAWRADADPRADLARGAPAARETKLALVLLFGAALSIGIDLRSRDALCLEAARQAKRWQIQLRAAAAPGTFTLATLRDEGCAVLVVSAAPTFATKWLVPRLSHFNDAHPDINIRIDASLGMISDFDRDGVHVAVRLGGGDYPGMRVDKLVDEDVAPACAPALLAESHPHPLRAPDDLRHHRLIHVDWGPVKNPPTWKVWCEAAGVTGINVDTGPIFSVEDLAISAAMAGQGVVLVSTLAARDDLAAGRLVRPFDIVIPSNSAFWVVAPERTADRPKVAAFREWLFDEIRDPMPLVS